MDISALNFDKGAGLVTVVAQDADSGAVLMVAHADRTAIEETLRSGEMHYHSRTRGLWHKGATSGNTQRVLSLTSDCDGDAILARIAPDGPACHTGSHSCFGPAAPAHDAIAMLDFTIAARRDALSEVEAAPAAAPSYTQKLLADRNLRLKKLGEEAAELITACGDSDRARAVEEAADLIYHTAVALHAVGASLDDVRRALGARARPAR